jgi:hypothetical protein
MKISKEKFQKLMSRGKKGARSAVTGSKGTMYESVAGAAAGYAETLVKKNFSAVASRPWAGGAALVVAGHLIKRSRKFGTVGAAIVGAGGYSLAVYLQNRKAAAAATPAAAPAPSQTAFVDYQDTGNVTYISPARAVGF